MKDCDRGDECVLKILVRAGYERPVDTALEMTCFPMDCATASEQAKRFIADPKGYAEKWYAEIES